MSLMTKSPAPNTKCNHLYEIMDNMKIFNYKGELYTRNMNIGIFFHWTTTNIAI
jgi:hypothetical protein